MKSLNIPLFFLALSLCLFPWMSPGIALILGVLISYCGLNPYLGSSQRVSKQMMAWSIVGLGTTVKIASVYAVSVSSFALTVFTLAVTIGGGWLIGGMLGVSKDLRALIASGTAICGATAIAAVGETLKAKKEEMSLALGVILILNGIGLFLFPYLGHLLNLTPQEFGVWAGLAIHDTSSVVGAAIEYGVDSVETATTVKLARAVWIAPLTILFAYALGPKDGSVKFKLPWFIGGFIVAAAVFSFIPSLAVFAPEVGFLARKGFVVAIFLMGANINISSLKELGFTPLIYGVVLWVISSVVSLLGVI